MSADDRHPEPIDDESPLSETLLTYGAPFFGTLLVAVGIAGGTLGGYAVVQSQLNLCGSPTIVVYSPGATEQLTAATRTDPLREFGIEELSPAERRAFEDATISSANPCLSVDPLLFPLGVVSILLGVLGILTPPLYRKLLEREERARGTNQ
jgi:hypothetical protein